MYFYVLLATCQTNSESFRKKNVRIRFVYLFSNQKTVSVIVSLYPEILICIIMLSYFSTFEQILDNIEKQKKSVCNVYKV